MNFLGPKHTGNVAIWLAIPVFTVVVVLIAAGVPHLENFHPEPPRGGLWHNWVAFVGMVLALSGVEAAASNTGVMKLDPDATHDAPSVSITSGRAVKAVMIEVVLATALLSVLAMCLPLAGEQLASRKEDMLRYMGEAFVGPWFGRIVGWVFALLLLSAVNTAIGGMIALLYVMARDRELPETFVQLNRFGVPWVPLIAATVLPVLVLDLQDSVEALSSLYAIGVVGAIVLDIGSCAFAKSLPLNNRQRWIMKGTVVLLSLIWITIALSKLHALVFVLSVLAVGLAVREYTRSMQRHGQPATAAVPAPAPAPPGASGTPFLGQFILVAARGWTPALQFALEESRIRNAHLLVLYCREVAVQADMNGNWQDDRDAKRLFTRLEAEAPNVKRLYSISDSPADTIIDIAATFGVDTVVLGGSRRAALVKLLKGNVVSRVASNLPESMHLIVIG
jgi:amino acid transporter